MSAIEFRNVAMKIEQSPFQNVYWFARYLLDTDQYGSLGRRTIPSSDYEFSAKAAKSI